MFSGYPMMNVDGTEWYFPQRLTDDTGGGGQRKRQPGPERPRRRCHHGSPPPQEPCGSTPSAPAWVGRRARRARSSWPSSRASRQRNLTLINRQSTYSHNDPAGAYPRNVFFAGLVPFLSSVGAH